MAVVFITGTPGAGKSYYAVLRILEELKHSDRLVITNIDGLDKQKVAFYLGKEDLSNLWTLDEFLSAVYGLANLHYDGNYRSAFLTLLNVDFWKRVILPYFYKELGYKRFVFYLDEFQSIIDEDTDLHQSQKFFFDYHRHLGIDIYLITQSIQRMNKAIRNIAEVELRLVNLRMFGLSSVVLLKTLIGGVVVKKKLLKYDPRIFVLYKSALVEHLKGVRGRPPVMLFVGLFLLLFALFQGFSYMSKTGGLFFLSLRYQMQSLILILIQRSQLLTLNLLAVRLLILLLRHHTTPLSHLLLHHLLHPLCLLPLPLWVLVIFRLLVVM